LQKKIDLFQLVFTHIDAYACFQNHHSTLCCVCKPVFKPFADVNCIIESTDLKIAYICTFVKVNDGLAITVYLEK